MMGKFSLHTFPRAQKLTEALSFWMRKTFRLEHLDAVPDAVLIVHSSDASYLLAHDTDPHIPAAVQRVAAALAASTLERETGKRPPIVIE